MSTQSLISQRDTTSPVLNIALWVIQIGAAAMFLYMSRSRAAAVAAGVEAAIAKAKAEVEALAKRSA